jgi:hypothetical protein
MAEMRIRNLHGGKGRPGLKADNLTAICERFSRKCGSIDVSENYGHPQSLEEIYFFTFYGVMV